VAATRNSRFLRYRHEIERLHQKHALTPKLYSLRQDGLSLAGFKISADEASRHLAKLVEERRCQYQPAQIRQITVKGKQREIFVFSLVDTIMHGAVASMLREAIEPLLSCRLYSYRKKISSLTAVQHFAEYVRRHRGAVADTKQRGIYVLRRDVQSYARSIPVGSSSRIWGLLRDAVPERWCGSAVSETDWALIERVVRPEVVSPEGTLFTPLRGTPLGQPISCVVFNLYLSELDRALEAIPGAFYARYSDDLLFAHSNIEVVEQVDRRLGEALSRLELELNSRKSRNLYMTSAGRAPVGWKHGEAAQYIPFLGMAVGADGTVSLSREKARALLRELRARAVRTARLLKGRDSETVGKMVCGAINESLERGLASFQQRSAPLLLGAVTDRKHLAQLDYWIARIVLKAVTGDAGIRAFRQVPYARIRRRWGLISLVQQRNRKNGA
jgi:hypothetical protein